MENQKQIADKSAQNIWNTIQGRLLWQYHKKDWPTNLRKLISNEVENAMDVAEAFTKEKFKHYIPVPTAGLGTRLKFLFTGKLK